MDIYEFIKNLKINTFVEVGCNIGTDTKRFRELHPNARIVCFEPDPRNLSLLKEQGIHDIAEIYPYALSNINGNVTFYLSNGDVKEIDPESEFKNIDWSLSSSLKRPTGHLDMHKWVKFDNNVEVPCIRLDDFEPLKNVTIDFIWADVQGAEDLVFSGSKNILKNTKYVYTEYSNTELYEKQLNLSGILELFGDSWQVVYDYGGDVLLKNVEMDYVGCFIRGGLGNQLFQMAFLDYLQKNTRRKIYIENNVPSIHSPLNYLESVFKNIELDKSPQGIRQDWVHEHNLHPEDWLSIIRTSNVMMYGYFQNYKYVSKEFVDKLSFDTSILDKYKDIENRIFIHIRGGDFKLDSVHDVYLVDYYKKAIKLFPSNSKFYIFTNDIKYTKTFDFLNNIDYEIIEENEIDSLLLMSRCNGGICANSTFSWWGAYINPNRKLILPSKWYNDDSLYTEGYYFPESTVLYDWDFVDKVMYINLDKRTDRRKHMEEMIKNFDDDEKVIRFSAIEDSPGAIGCTKSHIAVLKMAIANKWKNVLILEDDAQWNKFNNGYNKLKTLSSRDYDVIMLGGTFQTLQDDRVIKAKSAVAYLVNGHYMEKLLKNFEEGLTKLQENPNQVELYGCDTYWNKLQQTDCWYAINPCMIYQIPGVSDLENRFVDNSTHFNL